MNIVSAVILCTIVGAVGAIVLVAAAKFMAVEEDPRIEEVSACLAGANCGGCGPAAALPRRSVERRRQQHRHRTNPLAPRRERIIEHLGEQRAVRREFLPDELLEGLQIALDRLADHIECYHNRTLCLRRKKFCRIQTDRFPRRNTTVPSLGSIRAKVVIFR